MANQISNAASRFTLQRIYYPDATTGVIYRDGVFQCVTIELPWLDDEPDKSCIPEGTYHVTAYSSPTHPDVWLVNDVPGRSGVLIHNGNYASDTGRTDTLGCILVGETYGTLDGQRAVLHSDDTLKRLRAGWPGEFDLAISPHAG